MAKIVVTSAFGLEKLVKNEIQRMGFKIEHVENGAIEINADLEAIATLNLNLRCAERVFLCVGSFKATSFEALFQGVKSIPWEKYLTANSTFPVNAKSQKSTLFSLSDIQSISKKAIVEKLKTTYDVEWFKELGEEVSIVISILNDTANVLLDASGSGLHRRGYREKGNEAPLKETLAAALVLLSNWRGHSPLIDPMCGTGTILIEAAMLKKNIAPGLGRKFSSENWSFMPSNAYKEQRKHAYEAIDYDRPLLLYGYDSDPKVIEIAKENAELAGVDDCITFKVQDIKDWEPTGDYTKVICNPPYGERLEDEKTAFLLYKTLASKVMINPTWSTFVLTSHESFEDAFNKKADKNRKLYNGKIKCYYYQYYGQKPPRKDA